MNFVRLTAKEDGSEYAFVMCNDEDAGRLVEWKDLTTFAGKVLAEREQEVPDGEG